MAAAAASYQQAYWHPPPVPAARRAGQCWGAGSTSRRRSRSPQIPFIYGGRSREWQGSLGPARCWKVHLCVGWRQRHRDTQATSGAGSCTAGPEGRQHAHFRTSMLHRGHGQRQNGAEQPIGRPTNVTFRRRLLWLAQQGRLTRLAPVPPLISDPDPNHLQCPPEVQLLTPGLGGAPAAGVAQIQLLHRPSQRPRAGPGLLHRVQSTQVRHRRARGAGGAGNARAEASGACMVNKGLPAPPVARRLSHCSQLTITCA